MSKFAKVVMPLIMNDIKLDDFSEKSGFVDIYTYDPDNPGDYRSIYFVVNDDVRNALSIDRARRFVKSPSLKGVYTKRCNNMPYMVYKLSMTSSTYKMKDGVISPTLEERARILQFWGLTSDIGRLLLCNSTLSVETDYAMPLADEAPLFLENLI
jgi:hypothetical protein